MQAFAQSSTIHSHADIPEVANLGKRKASDSDEHIRPEKKKIMTVSFQFLSDGRLRKQLFLKGEPLAHLKPGISLTVIPSAIFKSLSTAYTLERGIY